LCRKYSYTNLEWGIYYEEVFNYFIQFCIIN
jgi:hypothetical protein